MHLIIGLSLSLTLNIMSIYTFVLTLSCQPANVLKQISVSVVVLIGIKSIYFMTIKLSLS